MLRCLGLPKKNIVLLIIIEALSFAVPGLILGLIMAYLWNVQFSKLIFENSHLKTSYSLTSDSIIMGFCIGILMPLMSNYVPIRRAMSKTLRDSLDITHRAADNITVIKKIYLKKFN